MVTKYFMMGVISLGPWTGHWAGGGISLDGNKIFYDGSGQSRQGTGHRAGEISLDGYKIFYDDLVSFV